MADSNAPQGQDNDIAHDNYSQSSGALGKSVGPVPSSTSAPRECYSPHGHTKPWWKKLSTWQFLVEIALFLVGIRVAAIYSGQLAQMIEANKKTERALGLSQQQLASSEEAQSAVLVIEGIS